MSQLLVVRRALGMVLLGCSLGLVLQLLLGKLSTYTAITCLIEMLEQIKTYQWAGQSSYV
jgi:hypothetical protein